MFRSDIRVIVIGRNESVRLGRSLASVQNYPTTYVDSGSDDGSPDIARATGTGVIELAPEGGYTAARARNAGLERTLADPDATYLQMLDGDTILEADWIAQGAAALDADPRLGGVFGRLREEAPDASVYAWLCDVEWATPPGPALFAGNVLLRAEALRDTGGYRADLIAGEDPDLAIRLRKAGWETLCLDTPMGAHDAAIHRFGPWWRRAVRAGKGFAALTALHPPPAPHDFARSRRRILFWGGGVPFAFLSGILLALLHQPGWLLLSAFALLLTIAQIIRVGIREAKDHGGRRGFLYAFFMAIAHHAEMIGLLGYHLGRGQKAA